MDAKLISVGGDDDTLLLTLGLDYHVFDELVTSGLRDEFPEILEDAALFNVEFHLTPTEGNVSLRFAITDPEAIKQVKLIMAYEIMQQKGLLGNKTE